jgi:hypothetical protein
LDPSQLQLSFKDGRAHISKLRSAVQSQLSDKIKELRGQLPLYKYRKPLIVGGALGILGLAIIFCGVRGCKSYIARLYSRQAQLVEIPVITKPEFKIPPEILTLNGELAMIGAYDADYLSFKPESYLRGIFFYDKNGNGVKDPDESEYAIRIKEDRIDENAYKTVKENIERFGQIQIDDYGQDPYPPGYRRKPLRPHVIYVDGEPEIVLYEDNISLIGEDL